MAAQTLGKALELRPRDAGILSSLGEIYREEREYELAAQAYREALTMDPNMETPAVGLALCLLSLGRPVEAADVLGLAYRRGMRTLRLLQTITTLPTAVRSIDVLGDLDRLAASAGAADAPSRNTLLFAKAAALDAVGRHAEAGNARCGKRAAGCRLPNRSQGRPRTPRKVARATSHFFPAYPNPPR